MKDEILQNVGKETPQIDAVYKQSPNFQLQKKDSKTDKVESAPQEDIKRGNSNPDYAGQIEIDISNLECSKIPDSLQEK